MLKETLKKDEIAAMKAKEKSKVAVLRLINADIKGKEINTRTTLSDEEIVSIIEKNIKQQKETLEYAEKLGDEEKISECNFAIGVLTPYLPAQLSDEEVENMLKEIISTNNYTAKDMGKIMKEIMPKVAGRYERGKINPMVKSLL
ncbi:GatB/YqeY domain-containing protein [Clostridium bornimense]|uniref:GatB/YqeY domain-containing protein n=1 Tax=Clostridium bornimense TaxID=1216932 RepID=UPI001C119713|nr:GatB/YqeY domain-containing protein [Clostridium bornimense]MBU5316055.1 GatB/YqeY domain-containing protein [Clostridium bornimense]